MNKDYSMKIDKEGNISFHYDEDCFDYLGSPESISSSVSYELKNGKENSPANLIKTTTIKEKYILKNREVRREDVLFALHLASQRKAELNLSIPFPETYFTPGAKNQIRIAKLKEKEIYKMIIDIEYDEYYEGQLEAKKVQQRATFLVDENRICEIYSQLSHSLNIKEAMMSLGALKEILKDNLLPEEKIPAPPVKGDYEKLPNKDINKEYLEH